MDTYRRARWISACVVTAAALAAALGGMCFTGDEARAASGAKAATSPLYSQSCASLTIQKQGVFVQMTVRGVSPLTLSYTTSPYRIVATLDTRSFVNDWTIRFKDKQPSATLVIGGSAVVGSSDGPKVGAVVSARYVGSDVVYLCTPGPQGVVTGTGRVVSLPATFGPSAIVLDPAGTPSGGFGGSAGKVYGMACGYWQKTINDYQDITTVPNYFRDYFATIAPATQWVTNYGLLSQADVDFVTAAHNANLKVSVCIDPTWDGRGAPAATNADQVARATKLVQDGVADSIVVGNEVLAKFADKSDQGYTNWKNAIISYIEQLKAVKGPGGRSVPVGTSYAMKVCDDKGKAQEEEVNRHCDFLQVTIHPANVARDGLDWGPGGGKIVTPADGVWFLDKIYKESRDQMDAWGMSRTPLEIRETGWPSSSDYGNGRDGYFTPANAKAYLDQVVQWASGKNVNVYWFEAVDEPPKDSHHPAQYSPYDLKDFEANWGMFHWTPVNGNDLKLGGTFSKKY